MPQVPPSLRQAKALLLLSTWATMDPKRANVRAVRQDIFAPSLSTSQKFQAWSVLLSGLLEYFTAGTRAQRRTTSLQTERRLRLSLDRAQYLRARTSGGGREGYRSATSARRTRTPHQPGSSRQSIGQSDAGVRYQACSTASRLATALPISRSLDVPLVRETIRGGAQSSRAQYGLLCSLRCTVARGAQAPASR